MATKKKSGNAEVGNIASRMAALVQPVADELGFSLWDVEYVKEGASWYLRFTIDSEQGIDIDDCEKFHRRIDPMIDEADPIPDFYYLEVSSPGLERDLRTDAHFEWALGKEIVLRLFRPLDGVREWKGTLREYDAAEGLLLELPDGSEKRVPRDAVAKANLFYDFDAEPMDDPADPTEN